MQNFAEFQCRAETDWQHFTPAMEAQLQEGLPRSERWQPRRMVACSVCTMLAWAEERVFLYIAGHKCSFKDPMAVASLLDPERYALVWKTVPKNELMASTVSLKIPAGRSAGSLLVWKNF